MKTEMIAKEGFILFDCEGAISLDALLALVERIRVCAQDGGFPKNILVDISRLEGELTILQRYAIGEEVSMKLLGLRLAVLAPKDKINKVAENTAVNRGASMFVSHVPEDALNWLLRYR